MVRKDGLTRRGFLGGAAVALGAPLVVGPSAIGAGRATPSNRITMGFIGIGMQARGHLGGMLGRPDVQVLAVCDCDKFRREEAAKKVNDRYGAKGDGGCGCYNDFRDLADRRDIDAVLMAPPDHWHAIMTIRCAEAGKDVYCEKPLSLTIRDARAMANAIRRYGRVFQTGSQQRSSREFRFACEMVRSGRIGKVERVVINVGGPSGDCNLPGQPVPEGLDWEMWLGPAPWRPYHATICPGNPYNIFPNWRSFRDYSGGGMTDWGAHHFDIAQWGLGMDQSGPVEVHPPDGKEFKQLTYKYANGVVMTHGGGGRMGVNFYGTNGAVFVDRGRLETEPKELKDTPTAPNEVHLYNSPGHHEDWLRCIRNRQKPICDIEVGLRTITVCHLGNIAYWLKRPLRWDPAKEELIGDPEAARWLDRSRRQPWAL